MLDKQFIEKISSEQRPPLSIKLICDEFERFHKEAQKFTNYPKVMSIAQHDDYILFLGFAESFCEAYRIKVNPPTMGSDKDRNISSIFGFFRVLEQHNIADLARVQLEMSKSHFAMQLGKAYAYEFTDGDLTRIQSLISELRSLISKNRKLDDDHKRRLLVRLERLQSELHKRVSDLDRFWGLIGDAGVVLGKLGKDAKPIVDRIRELAQIAWRTQSIREGLPSDSQVGLLTQEEEGS